MRLLNIYGSTPARLVVGAGLCNERASKDRQKEKREPFLIESGPVFRPIAMLYLMSRFTVPSISI
jgi:hypothetical protein